MFCYENELKLVRKLNDIHETASNTSSTIHGIGSRPTADTRRSTSTHESNSPHPSTYSFASTDYRSNAAYSPPLCTCSSAGRDYRNNAAFRPPPSTRVEKLEDFNRDQLYYIKYEDFILGIELRENDVPYFREIAFLILVTKDNGLQLYYNAGPSGCALLPKLAAPAKAFGHLEGTKNWQVVGNFTYIIENPYIYFLKHGIKTYRIIFSTNLRSLNRSYGQIKTQT